MATVGVRSIVDNSKAFFCQPVRADPRPEVWTVTIGRD